MTIKPNSNCRMLNYIKTYRHAGTRSVFIVVSSTMHEVKRTWVGLLHILPPLDVTSLRRGLR